MKKSNLLMILAIAVLTPILVSSCDCKYKESDFVGKYEFNRKDSIQYLFMSRYIKNVEVLAAKITLDEKHDNTHEDYNNATISATCYMKELSDSLGLEDDMKLVADIEIDCNWFIEHCFCITLDADRVDDIVVKNIRFVIDDNDELKEIKDLKVDKPTKQQVEKTLYDIFERCTRWTISGVQDDGFTIGDGKFKFKRVK